MASDGRSGSQTCTVQPRSGWTLSGPRINRGLRRGDRTCYARRELNVGDLESEQHFRAQPLERLLWEVGDA